MTCKSVQPELCSNLAQGAKHFETLSQTVLLIAFYLEFVLGVELTLGVVSPDSVALWMVEPLAIRITHFGNLLCRRRIHFHYINVFHGLIQVISDEMITVN